MPSWLLKAAVQGTISVLPGRQRLNHLLQRHITGSVELQAALFERKVGECARHLENYRAAVAGHAPPSAALELGTGWYPIVPVGLALAGTEWVTTFDINSLVDMKRTRRTLGAYASYLTRNRLALPDVRPTRAEALMDALGDETAVDVQDLLSRLGIELVVRDVRASGLPAHGIDLFVSNNTLEHISTDVLHGIMAEFSRLAAPGAVMDHFIDMSDHYAHFDRSISEFNYLRYPSRRWWIFNNRLQYQNRLRVSDYREILRHAGFEVVFEDNLEGSLEQLDAVKLAPEFERYSRQDLLVLRSWLTAVAASSDQPGFAGGEERPERASTA